MKLKIEDKVVQLTAEKKIFGRIVIMSQQRNIEMKEIFCYPLGPISWALASSMGTLRKTNKAILMPELEKNAESSEEVLSHSCTIIDGIALVRKIKTAGLTYEQFSVKLLNAVMSSGCSSTRVDAVFDVYRNISIKNAEHAHRKSGNIEFKKILGSQLIKQWNSFLSSTNNKTELIKFIFAEWKMHARLFTNNLILNKSASLSLKATAPRSFIFDARKSRHPSLAACSRCISKIPGYYNTYT